MYNKITLSFTVKNIIKARNHRTQNINGTTTNGIHSEICLLKKTLMEIAWGAVK